MAASSWPSSWFSAGGGIGSSTSSSMRTSCWPRAVTRVLDVVGRSAATTTWRSGRWVCASSERSESPRASSPITDTRRHSAPIAATFAATRSEEHTSELQSLRHLVCRLLLEKKKKNQIRNWLRTVHTLSHAITNEITKHCVTQHHLADRSCVHRPMSETHRYDV